MNILISQQGWTKIEVPPADVPRSLLVRLLSDQEFQRFIGENRYEGVLYFNKEGLDYTIWWLYALGVMGYCKEDPELKKVKEMSVYLHTVFEQWEAAAAQSEYRLEKLLAFFPDPEAKKGSAAAKKAAAKGVTAATGSAPASTAKKGAAPASTKTAPKAGTKKKKEE